MSYVLLFSQAHFDRGDVDNWTEKEHGMGVYRPENGRDQEFTFSCDVNDKETITSYFKDWENTDLVAVVDDFNDVTFGDQSAGAQGHKYDDNLNNDDEVHEVQKIYEGKRDYCAFDNKLS